MEDSSFRCLPLVEKYLREIVKILHHNGLPSRYRVYSSDHLYQVCLKLDHMRRERMEYEQRIRNNMEMVILKIRCGQRLASIEEDIRVQTLSKLIAD